MPMVRSPPLSGPLVCVLGVSQPDDNWRPDLPCLGGALIMDGIAPRDPFLRSPSTFCAGGGCCAKPLEGEGNLRRRVASGRGTRSARSDEILDAVVEVEVAQA